MAIVRLVVTWVFAIVVTVMGLVSLVGLADASLIVWLLTAARGR